MPPPATHEYSDPVVNQPWGVRPLTPFHVCLPTGEGPTGEGEGVLGDACVKSLPLNPKP